MAKVEWSFAYGCVGAVSHLKLHKRFSCNNKPVTKFPKLTFRKAHLLCTRLWLECSSYFVGHCVPFLIGHLGSLPVRF